ncbi:MAG: helix-turn-helix domain-containing protein, partial [Anaerolineales bacterium]|nr:helix-turn-helix domain-containing protein [Anaerolineales bacterium]
MTDDWLSLSAAAKLLGVHPSTVRLWSDKGAIPVHKTQGGHRRYKRGELLLWAESNSKSRSEAIEPEGMMNEVVKNVRMQISEGHLEAESWYQKLDDDARTQYRMSARSLFQGLMTYVSTNGKEA